MDVAFVVKVLIIGLLIAIVIALATGGIFLIKDPSTSKRTVRALSWRVGLQVTLIVLLAVASFMGWLKPHDPRRIDLPRTGAGQAPTESAPAEPAPAPTPPPP